MSTRGVGPHRAATCRGLPRAAAGGRVVSCPAARARAARRRRGRRRRGAQTHAIQPSYIMHRFPQHAASFIIWSTCNTSARQSRACPRSPTPSLLSATYLVMQRVPPGGLQVVPALQLEPHPLPHAGAHRVALASCTSHATRYQTHSNHISNKSYGRQSSPCLLFALLLPGALMAACRVSLRLPISNGQFLCSL